MEAWIPHLLNHANQLSEIYACSSAAEADSTKSCFEPFVEDTRHAHQQQQFQCNANIGTPPI